MSKRSPRANRISSSCLKSSARLQPPRSSWRGSGARTEERDRGSERRRRVKGDERDIGVGVQARGGWLGGGGSCEGIAGVVGD